MDLGRALVLLNDDEFVKTNDGDDDVAAADVDADPLSPGQNYGLHPVDAAVVDGDETFV